MLRGLSGKTQEEMEWNCSLVMATQVATLSLSLSEPFSSEPGFFMSWLVASQPRGSFHSDSSSISTVPKREIQGGMTVQAMFLEPVCCWVPHPRARGLLHAATQCRVLCAPVCFRVRVTASDWEWEGFHSSQAHWQSSRGTLGHGGHPACQQC